MPTLVEVKHGENPDIRRYVVGQMIEYAAHAAATWTAGELRRSFEETSRELPITCAGERLLIART